MPGAQPETLRQALARADVPASSVLSDGNLEVSLSEVYRSSPLGPVRRNLAGKSVLIAVSTQIEAALCLIDLDGHARRLVLVPPDVRTEALSAIIRDAEVDAIVCTDPQSYQHLGVPSLFRCHVKCDPNVPLDGRCRTEWLMLTSGTTGDPKIAVHTLAGLSGAIPQYQHATPRPVWATFYDIRRYGGLQIFLRAMFGGASLILSRPGEALADHLARLEAAKVTHVSGTPTHWRRTLMSAASNHFHPSYVRLSGEIVDQGVLDALRAAHPGASIGHAYASTEAGVGFDVDDGLEGFPASYLDAPRNGVEIRLVDGALRLRSGRMASAYAGRPDLDLIGDDGFVDTGDMVEIRQGRCFFVGRRGGIINVGGLKVHPEEIESVINRHDAVRQSRVKPRKSPILGAIVVADIVLSRSDDDADAIKQDILALCRAYLPNHKIPALLNVVTSIEMTAGGKVSRQHA